MDIINSKMVRKNMNVESNKGISQKWFVEGFHSIN